MESHLLDKERFEGAKELSQISMKIAEARALLSELDSSKDEYLNAREREAAERIEILLAKSGDLIRQIGENHDELTKYRRELEDYCNELRYFNERVMQVRQDFEDYFETENVALDAKHETLKEYAKQLAREASDVRAERKQLVIDRKRLADDQKLINDRRETLDRGFAELKRLKTKKHGNQ